MNNRMVGKERQGQIVTAALKVAERDGFSKVMRDAVAREAGCSTSLIFNYFKTMPQLRRAVMRAAVASGNLKVIAQGLALKDPRAISAPPELKERALASLA